MSNNEPIFHWDLQQNSDEWDSIRAGKLTASKIKTLLVSGKDASGFGTGAFTELYKMVEEKITGIPRISFGNGYTDYGHETETIAAKDYELQNFVKTRSVGFVEVNEWIGCSPDRLIPEKMKGLEIKCLPVEHMQILMSGNYRKDEYIQCQYSLWCTGYDTWDLYYFHEILKPVCFIFEPDLELFEKFTERTNAFIALIKDHINKYNLI